MMDRKILLVDDEPGIRKVLGILLSDIGYQVLTAQNGEEALKIFNESGPPLVLTDIKMPGMDGIQLLQKIKAEQPETEVIMITGHGEMELAIQSLKYDAVDFITKPIHDEALEIALKRANEKIDLKTQIRDYTENLEKLVSEKTEKLIAVERLAAVGETVAGLAHAIKNIAGGLTGGTFVLEKGIELDNKTYLRQGWDMVKENVRRIKSLAMDLLNYAKDREPDWQLCDANEPVQDVYQLMHPVARAQDITLDMALCQDLSEVWFDREGIHRVLLNLVINAIDASAELNPKQRHGRVMISSLKRDDWAVEYQVTDNGPGMDEETMSKVFHRFFSTKGSRGTGLGLMIAKKIMDEHGGTITLESKKGSGTTVAIRIPVRKTDASLT